MDFIIKNNIFGIAIGLLVATKVGEVGKSIVEDLLTPALFAPTMKKLHVEKLEDLSRKGILYGRVLARTIDFLLVAFVVFLLIRYLGIKTG